MSHQVPRDTCYVVAQFQQPSLFAGIHERPTRSAPWLLGNVCGVVHIADDDVATNMHRELWRTWPPRWAACLFYCFVWLAEQAGKGACDTALLFIDYHLQSPRPV
ncbi:MULTISPECIES: hypothetical protein [Ralstonia solanacearum species complex]|nr:hypothetical protein [Ralstonia solanacearum]